MGINLNFSQTIQNFENKKVKLIKKGIKKETQNGIEVEIETEYSIFDNVCFYPTKKNFFYNSLASRCYEFYQVHSKNIDFELELLDEIEYNKNIYIIIEKLPYDQNGFITYYIGNKK